MKKNEEEKERVEGKENEEEREENKKKNWIKLDRETSRILSSTK